MQRSLQLVGRPIKFDIFRCHYQTSSRTRTAISILDKWKENRMRSMFVLLVVVRNPSTSSLCSVPYWKIFVIG
jgi:hypothetical protein